MAVKRVKVHGRKVWQARVAYKGLRKSTIRETKEQARDAEAGLLQELKAKVGQVAQEAQAPATLRGLFEFYAEDLEARGKGEDTIGRAVETARALERLMPDLIDRPVTKIREADIFAFRKARAETSLSAVALRERAQALRRAGKPAKADVFERKALDRQGQGHEAEHDQPRPPDDPGHAEARRPGLPLPGRGLLPGRRDARAVAPARG